MSYSDLIRRETQELASQLPTYTLIDESELLLTIPAAFNPDRGRDEASLS